MRQLKQAAARISSQRYKQFAKFAGKLSSDRLIKFVLIQSNVDLYMHAAAREGNLALFEDVVIYYDTNFPDIPLRAAAEKYGVPIQAPDSQT